MGEWDPRTMASWLRKVNKAIDKIARSTVGVSNKADIAALTAQSKNSVSWEFIAPDMPGENDGDLWYVIDQVTGVAEGVFRWDANISEWVPQLIDGSTLTNVTAAHIVAGAIDGLTITGATIRTAAGGQRAVLSGSGIRFYDATDTFSGGVTGFSNGAAGGLIQISSGDDANALYIGTAYLPLSGTVAMKANNAYIGQLYVDQLINPLTNGPFSGVYLGTRTQAIGSAARQGVGVFKNTPGTETSFMNMGLDGRFILAQGSYVITITMTLGDAKSTGRTFLELVDTADVGTPLFRNLMPPNVGEDTVSTAGTVYTNGVRQFRVQAQQLSDGPNNIKFTLGVTRIS